MRRNVLLVLVFALALLAFSRVGGLAGKIGADGLAWAQDSSPADLDAENDSSDAATAQDTADKTGPIKFSGKGTIDGTPYTTGCTHHECLSITGNVTKTSLQGLGEGTVAGDSTLDSCTINKKAKKECCTFASTETYSFSSGDLDVLIGGTACGKKPTKITVKNSRFEVTNGTGLFAGATGSGKANLAYDNDTGAGKFSFSGNLTE